MLDEEGYNNSDGVQVAPEQIEQAYRGAACCPERAITLIEDEMTTNDCGRSVG
jgi:hypothetical protein